MKSLFSIFITIVLGFAGILPAKAQYFFNKRYTAGTNANLFTNALEKKGKFYVISGAIDSINYAGSGLFKNKTGIKFLVLDGTGNILHAKLYQRDDKIYTYISQSNSLIALPDGTFLHAFSVQDTVPPVYNPAYYNIQLAIAQFDSIGNVLMYREYDRPYCNPADATYHVLMDFKPDAYGNWLMLSSLVCSGKVVFCLRKLDSGFNEIWVKNFTTSGLHNVPKHLLIEDDGYVMTGGVNNGNVKSFPDYYTSVLIKCDTAGTKLWDWHNTLDTNGHIQYTINDIIRSKDGGYIYCGSGEGRPTYFDGSKDWSGFVVKGWVEKLDASRNSVWKRSLGYVRSNVFTTEQTVLKELPDGDIIVAGSIVVPLTAFDSSQGFIRGSLARLSGVDGSIIWHHMYQSPEKNDTMNLNIYDMRQTADGGYILAGEATNTIDRKVGTLQRGWLIKVDSNGCEGPGDPQCWPTAIPLPGGVRGGFNIYPNPSNGNILLEASSSLSLTSASVKVYDLLGRTIYQSKISFNGQQASIQLNAPNGIYIIELTDAENQSSRQRIEIRN